MGILKFLSIVVLLLLPFGELLRWDLGNNISIKLLDVSVAVVAGVFLIYVVVKRIKFRELPFLKQIGIFAGLACLSLILNIGWLKPHEIFVSSLYLIRWIIYAILFLVIFQFDSEFKKKLLQLLFIGGMLTVIFGFAQYFIYPDIKNLRYLGWDDHMYRMVTLLLDPNFGGAIIVLFMLLTAGFLYKNWKEKKQRVVVFYTVVLTLTLFAVFLTFSGSALLMLIVSSIVFLIMIRHKRIILLLLFLLVLYVAAISPKFYVENINLFRTSSSSARLYNYSVALSIFSERPLLGVGFNSYRYAKEYYKFPQGWVKAPSHADAGVDNSFLFVLATTGIVGLSAYVYLWFSLLRKSYSNFNKKENILVAVLLASVAGLFVDAMFINSLFYSHIMAWIWILFGLCFSEDAKGKYKKGLERTPSTGAGLRVNKLL